MGKYGSWDEIDKRTDLDEYTKKELKMDEYLYLDALSATGSMDLSFPSVRNFRRFIKEFENDYPSVVAFLNDNFWDQVVPETTKNNDKILERMKEMIAQGAEPGDLGFPEFEGESLLESMLIIFGHYYQEKLMNRFIEKGIDTYEEQTDPAKQPVVSKIKSKTNK